MYLRTCLSLLAERDYAIIVLHGREQLYLLLLLLLHSKQCVSLPFLTHTDQ